MNKMEYNFKYLICLMSRVQAMLKGTHPFSDVPQLYDTWLGREDSNPRMLGPEPSALPLGDAPKFINFKEIIFYMNHGEGSIFRGFI